MNIYVRCFEPGCSNNGIKYCSACRLVPYCSNKCMTADWPAHKKECRRRNADDLTLRDFIRKYLSCLVQSFGLDNMFATAKSKQMVFMSMPFIEDMEYSFNNGTELKMEIITHDQSMLTSSNSITSIVGDKINLYDPKNEIILVLFFVLERINYDKAICRTESELLLGIRGASVTFIINKKGGVLPHGNISNL